MIIVKLMGGLGNQMFQYAVARQLAYKFDVPMKMDISFLKDHSPRPDFTYRNYELGIFNLKELFAVLDEVGQFVSSKPQKILPKIAYKVEKLISGKKYIKEECYCFDPNILKASKDTYLEGFWQTEKYFKDIETTIRKEFSFKKNAEGKILELQSKINSLNSVGIHIRRGDYVTNKSANSFHGLCSLDYYHDAINYILENIPDAHFFVFSDDMDWVKKNLVIQAPHEFVENDKSVPDYEDMRLMSSCKHNIIANSSFSWWAAWLNNNDKKLVIAPKDWFADKSINTQDLIPNGWLKL